MKKFLVIGYGSGLRGDDNLGPHVVEGLYDFTWCNDHNVRIMSLPQLDVTLSLDLCWADTVIFVDARSDDNDEPVVIQRVYPSPGTPNPNHSSHSVGLPELLCIVQNWYNSEPICYAVMPKGYDFSISESLSEGALIAAAEARSGIIEILQTVENPVT